MAVVQKVIFIQTIIVQTVTVYSHSDCIGCTESDSFMDSDSCTFTQKVMVVRTTTIVQK